MWYYVNAPPGLNLNVYDFIDQVSILIEHGNGLECLGLCVNVKVSKLIRYVSDPMYLN